MSKEDEIKELMARGFYKEDAEALYTALHTPSTVVPYDPAGHWDSGPFDDRYSNTFTAVYAVFGFILSAIVVFTLIFKVAF